ncbi:MULTISPECIES: NADH:flavin oxidoreductase [Polyangium]|uniref:NADH:flavin oxidoreductase n=2 Tax=Polyangium TaxID=55 RepID=A0A4U1J288_9BACT|nr:MULTISPECIES: NADH:flavin oxidoreductase [Polyangium]MDI1436664.1 NADH:flavin oxidoreductase [Polyangium sorediatum]TKD01188.1 NADH:flavin oxidoreductase [Polyangium fumosum]
MASKDLFEPLTFRNGRTARNRVALAAMTNLQSHADGALSDDEHRWLKLRAEGGFGVITTCASHVTQDGQGWDGELGIFDDRLLPGLTRLATTLREHGAVSMVQIFHGGARADARLIGTRPWSASEMESDPANPRAATSEDIERVIAAFRDAAVRASRAGFDGVELHGAHGYLLGQFLSATGNKRDDAYGGSLENRARLMREATRAVRAAVPASFLVGMRISPEDMAQSKGLDLDENLTLSGWLADDGIDFLHVSLWDSFANTKKRPDEHPIPLFRRALPADVPLLVAGKIWTRAEATSLLEQGADALALGRAAILNPDWPRASRDPAWQPTRPPATPDELRARGLGETFVNYMRRWKGFVADEAR